MAAAKKKTGEKAASSKPAPQDHSFRAVVDIGSNSVRLVVYEGPARAPFSICNEKALCGLGRDMRDDRSLNPSAVEDALATLKRFRLILKAFNNPPTYAIATAAVREASDGAAFVKQVKKLGFDVSVISGPEEAELAAYGVISVEPNAAGLVGDMGGGSLELVSVSNGKLDDGVSLPIGPLSLMRRANIDQAKAIDIIKTEFAKTPLLDGASYPTVYTVGGAWRSLARIHMNLKQYPLSVLHHYELSAASAIEVCDLVARQSRKSLEEIPGISRKRLDTLPFAALALKLLLQQTKAKSVVVSSGGVREGLLYRNLSDDERCESPLAAVAQFYAGRYAPNAAFGAAAFQMLEGLFAERSAMDARIVDAACKLIDIAAYSHPDLRGRQAFDTALSAPFVGLDHHQRIWIALALLCRYNGRNAQWPNEQAVSLLSWDEQQSAMQLGLAMRFVASIAPKSPSLLEGLNLSTREGSLILRGPPCHEALMGETPRKRFDALASSMELAAAVDFE